MRIAVVGGGISGIAAARVFGAHGHDVVVFERGERLGGVWAVAYPEVRLQNTRDQYRLADFPWPFEADLHPTREQILRYLEAAVDRFRIDLRPRHEIVSMHEVEGGWDVEVRSPAGTTRSRFEFVLVAAGQYTGEQVAPSIEGRERFTGEVITDRHVKDLGVLAKKRVTVVGFGKSAVDMASFAAQRGSEVTHVFREPRWLLPKHIFGIHSTQIIFARMSTAMIPSWAHGSRGERFLHARAPGLVGGFWSMIARVVREQTGLHGRFKDPAVRKRMAALLPEQSVHYQMRSALALAPDDYYPLVIEGRIEPRRGEVKGFGERALMLADGTEVPSDLVVLSTGFTSPRFPFMPERHRTLLESEPDGAQLYRHLLHPRIPRVGFAGYNHGFFHVPGVEIASLWLAAWLRGDLELPPAEEMEHRIEEIRAWKREHVLFEPSRSCAVNTRFHQYLDVLLQDLGLSPNRKSNPIAEALAAYSAADYDGVLAEYEGKRSAMSRPRRPLALST